MKKDRNLPFLIVSIVICSCHSMATKFNEAIWHDKSGSYVISENMADSCNTLSLITRDQNYMRLKCVMRIGDDDHFIIAETKSVDRGLQYWIINKEKDRIDLTADHITEGPYNLTDFTKREIELGIQNLTFQKVNE